MSYGASDSTGRRKREGLSCVTISYQKPRGAGTKPSNMREGRKSPSYSVWRAPLRKWRDTPSTEKLVKLETRKLENAVH